MTLNEALKILGVNFPATTRNVKKDAEIFKKFIEDAHAAWKKLMIKHHPDRGGKHEMALKINQAWERVKQTKASDLFTITPGTNRAQYDHNVFRQMMRNYNRQSAEAARRMQDQVLKNVMREIHKDALGEAYSTVFGGTFAKKKAQMNEDKWFEEFMKGIKKAQKGEPI